MPEHNNATALQRLIIRVSRKSLSFSIINATSGSIRFSSYAMKSGISLSANLREAFQKEESLQVPYSFVLVTVDTPTLTVPMEGFRESEKELLYHHAYSGHEQDLVSYTMMEDLHCAVLFSLNRNVKTIINDHFPNARYMAAIAPVWRHLYQRNFATTRTKLYAYFHEQHMDVFCYGQNRFKFCNSFDGSSQHDALYYLLFAWKNLGLQCDHDELYMVGQLPGGEALSEEIKKYIPRSYVILPSGEFNRSAITQIEGMPYDLMTLFIKGR